eukprot:PhF_6_TR29155/c0_g2_i2/m.42609
MNFLNGYFKQDGVATDPRAAPVIREALTPIQAKSDPTVELSLGTVVSKEASARTRINFKEVSSSEEGFRRVIESLEAGAFDLRSQARPHHTVGHRHGVERPQDGRSPCQVQPSSAAAIYRANEEVSTLIQTLVSKQSIFQQLLKAELNQTPLSNNRAASNEDTSSTNYRPLEPQTKESNHYEHLVAQLQVTLAVRDKRIDELEHQARLQEKELELARNQVHLTEFQNELHTDDIERSQLKAPQGDSDLRTREHEDSSAAMKIQIGLLEAALKEARTVPPQDDSKPNVQVVTPSAMVMEQMRTQLQVLQDKLEESERCNERLNNELSLLKRSTEHSKVGKQIAAEGADVVCAAQEARAAQEAEAARSAEVARAAQEAEAARAA